MRRLLAIPMALALMLPMAAAVSAAAPATFEVNSLHLDCEPETNDLGTAVTGGFADDFTVQAYLDFWPAPLPPFEGPPAVGVYSTTLISADDLGAVVSVELGDYVDDGFGGFFIAEPNGDLATLTVVYNAGDPTPIDNRYRIGNQQVRDVGLHWELAPTVEVDGPESMGDVSFDSCFGIQEQIDRWQTSPNAFVNEFAFTNLGCEFLEGTDGSQAFLFGGTSSGFGDDFGGFDVFVDTGTEQLAGFGELTQGNSRHFSGSTTISTEDGSVSLQASFDASFTVIASQTVVSPGQNAHYKVSQAFYAVSGTLTLGNGVTYDLSSCSADSYSQRNQVHNPNGPKIRSPAPANDAPSGAVALAGGQAIRVDNGAAALPPEEPMSCTIAGRTVWYTVTGTGGDITIDTARSNFDTAVAVYVDDGGTLTEVACNDDEPASEPVRTLQAIVTFPTDAGVTYYVQVGGFDASGFDPAASPEYGRLRLSVS
ncbi:MAG: hypothetical protein ABI534_02900 [Chloroflexota bacterium]